MLRLARHLPSWDLLYEIDLSYNKIECLDVLASGNHIDHLRYALMFTP